MLPVWSKVPKRDSVKRKNNKVPHSAITPQERLARFRLYRTENVGPSTFYQLLKKYGSALEAIEILPSLAHKGGRHSNLKVFSQEAAEKEMDAHEKFGAQVMVYGDLDFPQSLARIGDAAPVISLKGDLSLLKHQKPFGIVGARNASLTGKKIALQFAQEMGQKGYVIVSGLARGIDTNAHEGSFETGTIAVIAGGIDQIYPPENKGLYEKICERGLLIAESPIGCEPQANLFPRRNRLISGLSKGILVVEAAFQSGSLLTAKYAAEQNKEVFVIPGSPMDPRYKGSHQLIKTGAILTTCVQDIVDILERPYALNFSEPLEEQEEYVIPMEETLIDGQSLDGQILEQLSPTPIPLDDLIRSCQGASQHILSRLLELELAGKLVRLPGNMVCQAAWRTN